MNLEFQASCSLYGWSVMAEVQDDYTPVWEAGLSKKFGEQESVTFESIPPRQLSFQLTAPRFPVTVV
jgi:hypothetical protein